VSLNSTATALTLNDALQSLLVSKTENAFLSILETTLDNAFQEATPNLKNFLLTAPAGSLNFPLTDLNGNKILTPENIGLECSRYWELTITPGEPESCNGIDNIENDASKISSPIASKIAALNNRSMTTLSTPYFKELIDIIFDNVKTIVWTINESSTSCSSTLTGNVN